MSSTSRAAVHDYEAVPVESGNDVLRKLDAADVEHVYVACSGGDDSITALKFAVESPAIEVDGVVHIDTGFGVSQTTQFVREQCEQMGLDLVVVGNDNARWSHERYEVLVRLFGFPGSVPQAHSQIRKR